MNNYFKNANNYNGVLGRLLRKGRENMKKIITIVSALALVGCMAILFWGCGADDKDMTTSPSISTTGNMTTDNTTNAGMVTDESGTENGVIGDIVTDMSEGMSEMITDVSEGISDILD